MTTRQIYETAFDSTVKAKDADYLDDLVQSPLICGTNFDQFHKKELITSSTGYHESTCKILPAKDLSSKKHAKSNNGEAGSKTFSPSVEFKKLDVGDENEDQLSINTGASTSKNKDFMAEYTNVIFSTTAYASTSSVQIKKDLYANGRSKSISLESSQPSVRPKYSNVNHQKTWELRSMRDDMKRNYSETTSAARTKLNLDFSHTPKRPRHHLTLDFSWTKAQDGFHEEIVEPNVQLQRQSWYHGSISRKDAENVLRLLKEGSFLVRCCEKSKHDYSLSLKSASGVMHVKITQSANGRFVLKQRSQSFDSIPEMVHHFSTHLLPFQGLEHVLLVHPVISQLL